MISDLDLVLSQSFIIVHYQFQFPFKPFKPFKLNGFPFKNFLNGTVQGLPTSVAHYKPTIIAHLWNDWWRRLEIVQFWGSQKCTNVWQKLQAYLYFTHFWYWVLAYLNLRLAMPNFCRFLLCWCTSFSEEIVRRSRDGPAFLLETNQATSN